MTDEEKQKYHEENFCFNDKGEIVGQRLMPYEEARLAGDTCYELKEDDLRSQIDLDIPDGFLDEKRHDLDH